MNKPLKILFICTGNTCRSPMAEYIAKHLLKKRGIQNVKVFSAGLCAISGTKMEPFALAALKELGVNCKERSAKMLDLHALKKYNYCITMTDNQKQALNGATNVKCISEFLGCEIQDPYKLGLVVYRQTAKELVIAVDVMLDELVNIG